MEKQRLIHGSAELVDKILWIPKTFTVRPVTLMYETARFRPVREAMRDI